ncbi:MAG: hypothetical protein KIT45_00740 [Fimbriimonadia bacterium]|nr:hypothetical protein [Fimbriimonadia bacterium]
MRFKYLPMVKWVAATMYALTFVNMTTAQVLNGSSNSNTPAVTGTNTGTGNAGFFQIINAASPAAAVFGQTNGTGAAVYGFATGTTGFATGIWGQSAAVSGTGLYGVATSNTGVNFGVYGLTNSPAGYAAYFVGRGYFSGNLGLGTTSPAHALDIQSAASLAMRSTTTAASATSISGRALGTGGTGVIGHSTNSNGYGIGVTGRADSAFGTGVYALASRSTGTNYGIYAITNSAAGYAGYFLGRGYFSGNVGIGTTNPSQSLDVRGTIQVQNMVRLDAADGPMIVRQHDPMNSGAQNGVGRWGMFMEPAALFISVPGTDYGGTSRIVLGGRQVNGQRQDWVTIFEGGDVGIGIAAGGFGSKLHIISANNSTLRLQGPGSAGSDNKINIGDGDYIHLWEDADDNLTLRVQRQGQGRLRVQINTVEWATSKPATVKLDDGTPVKMYSEESAEVFFSDYGVGQLRNGYAHIELDSQYLQTVTIDDQYPMMVFIQIEDPACEGVAVANKTTNGFDVIELRGGRSHARFSYRVVCHRKYYEGLRIATEEEDIAYNERMWRLVWPELLQPEEKKPITPTEKPAQPHKN